MNAVYLLVLGLGIAGAMAADAFADSPDLFSPAQSEGASGQAEPAYFHAYNAKESQLVLANASALDSESVSITLFGETIVVSRDRTSAPGIGGYGWFGSNDEGANVVLVVNGTDMVGSVEVADRTYMIYPSAGGAHEAHNLDHSKFRLGGSEEGGAGGQSGASGQASIPSGSRALINQLSDAYVGGDEVYGSEVTIDVLVAYTEEARDENSFSMSSRARFGVEETNDAFNDNKLPIELNLVDTERVRGYEEGGISSDHNNLKNPSHSDFKRVHALAGREDADIVILYAHYDVGDDGDSSQVRSTKCGYSNGFASIAGGSFAVVNHVCLGVHAFAHEVGHIMGAGYNQNHEGKPNSLYTNGNFAYGHGMYYESTDLMTIMGKGHPDCDDSDDDNDDQCVRRGIWSDPNIKFHGTSDPAGTEDLNWNAKVLFATAPHAASLRGGAVQYDSAAPTATVSFPTDDAPSGTIIDVTAEFSEKIHHLYPPTISFSHSKDTTSEKMTRTSDKAFSYRHILTDESGTVSLSASKARDIYGNEMQSYLAGTFRAVAPPDGTSIPAQISDDFESSLGKWSLGGDGDWALAKSHARAPGEDRLSNTVLSSAECDRYCRATLASDLDTTARNIISFDLFVDEEASSSEGLYVHYSVDGGSKWTELASYTGGGDRWESYQLLLDVPEDSAKLRLTARSNSNDEFVEVDNLVIRAAPEAADTAPPSISAPPAKTLEATAALTPVSASQLGAATATDAKDPSPSVSSNAPSSFPLGTTTVTWTATDASGNSATATQAVTVQDTTAPSVTAPSAKTLEATAALTPVSASQLGAAAASDSVDTGPSVSSNAPSSFPLGTTTVTWTATDASGNSATATQTVTVQDTTPPQVFVPADHIAEATGQLTPLSRGDYGAAAASDLADPSPAVTDTAPDSFPLGNTTITWTATDQSGNAASADSTISVRDTLPPAFALPLDDVSAVAENATAAVAYDVPAATDVVDRDVAVECAPAPGSAFAVGNTTVTCTATDDAGNSASSSFTVSVASGEPATGRAPLRITAPPSISVPNATGASVILTAGELGEPAVTGGADPGPQVSSDAPGAFPAGAATAVTWTAVDSAGNRATAVQHVLVYGRDAPVLAAPQPAVINATDAITYLHPSTAGEATLVRPEGGQGVVIHRNAQLLGAGSHTVLWRAVDGSRNVAEAPQNITIIAGPDTPQNLISSDSFGSSLGSWHERHYWRFAEPALQCAPPSTGKYGAAHSAEHGGSVLLHRSHDCGTTASIMRQHVTVPAGYGGGTMLISLDHLPGERNLPLHALIHDRAGALLGYAEVGTGMAGMWTSTLVRLESLAADRCPCSIQLYRFDTAQHEPPMRTYVDNVVVAMSKPASGASGAGSSGHPANAVTADALVEMLADAAERDRIVITSVYAGAGGATVGWEPLGEGADHPGYSLAAWPESDPGAVTRAKVPAGAHEHPLGGLAPGTNYTVEVAVAGDGSTAAALPFTTAPEGGAAGQ